MDVYALRYVIIILGAICALCVFGVVLLSALNHEVPPTLGSIASVCTGSLVGILVTPRQQQQQQCPNCKPSDGDKKL